MARSTRDQQDHDIDTVQLSREGVWSSNNWVPSTFFSNLKIASYGPTNRRKDIPSYRDGSKTERWGMEDGRKMEGTCNHQNG